MELERKQGFKQTEFGTIPNDWKEVNLGKSSILKARIGWQGLTTAEYLKSGDYFLITGTDFKNGYIDWDNCVYVEKIRYDQDKNIQIKIEDVLVTKDGTIGKVAYVDKLPMKTTLNSGVFVIRPINNFYNTRYFYFVLRSRHFKEFLGKLTAGSTISHLYQKDFVHYNFPLPPTLAEQKAIATALSDVDDLISSLDALIAKKKAIKQGAMQQLLTPPSKGGKRLDGFDGEWLETSLGEFAKINMGQSPLSSNYNTTGEGLPLVQGNADIHNRKTFIRNYTSQITKRADKGDIIMSVRAPVGEIAIADFDCCIGRGVCSLKSSNDFLYQFLVFFESSWAKFSTGSTFDSINSNQLKELMFYAPVDEEEQKAIAQILSDMDKELEELVNKKEKYEHIKQGMMQELLTGKTRLV